MAFTSRNPALRASVFEKYGTVAAGEAMTVEGTVNKTAFLLFLVVVTAAWVWSRVTGAFDPRAEAMPYLLWGVLGGLGFGLVTSFKIDWAPVTAPIYAVFEGLALGALSAYLELTYHGIVVPAVVLTFATFACVLLAYRAGILRATPMFTRVVVFATAGVALFYIVALVLSMFGVGVSYFTSTSTLSIVINIAIAVLAAMNLVLDFDFIASGAEANAPKRLEWYGAFGLVVTLIWLYVEILRLLSRLRRR
ncbi:MAG TPA: Bax inhibitor-1/YccA family protein [Gemmatimonadales bacterium]|nr:Bax inhibitor-1/YccA family protein [Gemmatimonadales bacterium]